MQLEELLQQCTVKLSIPGQRGWGTGFFVAPGLILTCAHVVKALGSPDRVQVRWQQQLAFAEAELVQQIPDLDLTLLQFTSEKADLPCVFLDEGLRAGQELYFFGYPDEDFEHGCPVTVTCEGYTGDVPPLIKFKLGQVRPGMSGSPLLNQHTGKVCGIVKFTRDRTSDLGGGAISTHIILEQFPKLRSLSKEFHERDRRWSALLPQTIEPNNYSYKEKIPLGNYLPKVSKVRIILGFSFLTLITVLVLGLKALSPLSPPFGRKFYTDVERVESQIENVDFVDVDSLRFVTEDVRFTDIDDNRSGDSNLLQQTLEIRFTIYNNSDSEINVSNFQVVVYQKDRQIFISSQPRNIVSITPENPFIIQNIVYKVAPKNSEPFLLRYKNTVGNGIITSYDVVGILVYYHSPSGNVGKLKSEKLFFVNFKSSEIVLFDKSYILNRIQEVQGSDVDKQQKEQTLENLRDRLKNIARHENL